MKLPVPAPTFADSLEKHASELVAILRMKLGPEVNGSYIHWDKLRHRPPPQGLSVGGWWLGLKLARTSIAKSIPLLAKDHAEFKVSPAGAMQRHLHYIDREAAGSIRGMEGRSEGAQPKYLIRSLIEEAMTSSQLEGAATTRAVAKEMLSTGRSPRDESERMIYNNYRVMHEIREWGKRPFTPEAIMEIHSMLTEGTLESADQCGRLRTGDDDVVIYDKQSPPNLLHIPPDAEELPERLRRLCAFANDLQSEEFVHPVVRAIAIHFQIGYDHPFCDGNGRTARTLFYWSMLNSGYWMTEYLSISSVIKKAPAKYLRAYLYTESDENDLSYFVVQQLEVVEKAIEGLHAYIARKAEENRRAEKLLRGASILGENLNHRQRAILANAIHHPDRYYTIANHQTAHRVTYPTALHDLKELERLGLLTKRKIGKAFHYTAAPDLPAKLSL